MSEDFKTLRQLYRTELLERTIPFWLKHGIDWQCGGINTCISDAGQVLSGDKYVWSQLRAIWTFSALYNKIERKPEYLDVAAHIFNFIQQHGRNERGEWYFCLNADGQPLFDGATSIYCDGFAIYGFTEFARATGKAKAIDLARQAYDSAQPRLARPGSYQTHPLPIPAGTKAHGISMIFASALGELGHYLNDRAVIDAALDHARQVMDVFRCPADQRLYEFVKLDNSRMTEPPGRVVNPGHAIESMWFMLHLFQRESDHARIQQAIETIQWHLELGWDDEYGGLFLARDAAGSFWEKKWDMKIWWPHTEALYALLLAYTISNKQWCLDWFRRIHDYAFSHFPVLEYGEWTQNLDRQGNRMTTTVALPVKDPFHLARALIYSVGALEQLTQGQT